MNWLELFLIAVSLSMDAFAVSICKGLSVKKAEIKYMLIVGVYFGGFQALMPAIGYFFGTRFEKYITSIDHWIAFFLLAAIGINMIKESLSKEEEEVDASFSPKAMFPLAVATSIDALAIGVTFAFLNVRLIPSISLIGVTTFVLSVIGIVVGNIFGSKYKSKAEFAGGVILILIGIKILLEHLGIISF